MTAFPGSPSLGDPMEPGRCMIRSFTIKLIFHLDSVSVSHFVFNSWVISKLILLTISSPRNRSHDFYAHLTPELFFNDPNALLYLVMFLMRKFRKKN